MNNLPGNILPFQDRLKEHGVMPLKPSSISTLQVNIGYRCNLLCRHCHVNASPERTEVMNSETMQHCLNALKAGGMTTLDITGGAPEMNPDLPWFLETARSILPEGDIMVRTNLAILVSGEKYRRFPELFRKHRITLIASLPCYTRETVDRQRGEGTFDRSIAALKILNTLGYGKEMNGPELNLVFNPAGPMLPAEQKALETDYREQLRKRFQIEFSNLFTITNMPISRFRDELEQKEMYLDYMNLLSRNFNPCALNNLMCRSTISVGWDGTMYDCDFNQMLNIPLQAPTPKHISEFNRDLLENRTIALDDHCYGCTAGSGSSCTGSLL
ncbi:MAG: arsenosugar biosynthesis radical SAM protein ArsS [Chlorobium sp.]|nr:arsenosugar biosynthesis radical SAM protein ArsS [Chlorobium sp.]